MYILLGRMADWQARLATANKERLAMQLLGWHETKIVACVGSSAGIIAQTSAAQPQTPWKKYMEMEKESLKKRNGERGSEERCHWPLCLRELVSSGPRRSGRRPIIRRPQPQAHRPRRRISFRLSACWRCHCIVPACTCL